MAAVRRRSVTTKIEFIGPFFARDPAKTFHENVKDFMDRVAALGEAEAQSRYHINQGARQPVGHGVLPARVSAHVVGRTQSLSGKRWAVTAVVGVRPSAGASKEEAIATMAAASRIEGREHVMRRTTTGLKRIRAQLLGDLLKGLH